MWKLPEVFKAIGAARFGVMAGVAAVLTGFFLYIAGAITEPPKSILYSGLEATDAAAVTQKLDTLNVKYDLKNNGGTILVPSDQVTKLRMDLAQDNLPSAGVGYEIFDKSDTFGATSFVQNINKLRAMEGELARSIHTIDGIQSVRVHLVVPQREVFARAAKPPSASVVVKTRGVLNHEQVGAIQHLVAAAVSGLKPGRVAIVDSKGNLLAGGEERTGISAATADQERNTLAFENRLRQRVQSIVESIVGQGHARVQVTANIDYNHVSETSETYDPDSKVVRSTSTTEQTSNSRDQSQGVSVGNAMPGGAAQGGGGSQSNSGNTQETTNYEISKTVRTSTNDNGEVKRLSVAVAVDGIVGDDGKYTPRTPGDMQQIDGLVKSAIGYDEKRGDQVKVVNIPFARVDTSLGTSSEEPFLGLDGADWFKIIEVGILSLTALLIGLFVLRPLIVRMFAPPKAVVRKVAEDGTVTEEPVPGAPGAPARPGGGGGGEPGKPESLIDITKIEGKVRESSIRKVGEVVESHPDEALNIIRGWIHEGT